MLSFFKSWLKDVIESREIQRLKRLIDEKDQEIVRLDRELAASHRQIHRQAANIMILCERLRAAGINDQINEDEKPKLRINKHA